MDYWNNSNPLDDALFSLETLQRKPAQRCILIQYRSVTSIESFFECLGSCQTIHGFVKCTCETKVPCTGAKFFIMSMEFDKNISDWSYVCTDHKNGNDFFMSLVK